MDSPTTLSEQKATEKTERSLEVPASDETVQEQSKQQESSPTEVITTTPTAEDTEKTDDVVETKEKEQTNVEETPYLLFNSMVDHKELTRTVWGDEIKQDNFERWSQGFIFDNKKEVTALLQYNGGPCAVIAAVQAFLLRELLFCPNCGDNWRNPNESELNMHLTDSLLSIFINVSSANPKFLVFYDHSRTEDKSNLEDCDSEGMTKSPVQSDDSNNSKRVKLGYEAFSKKLKVYKYQTLNELKTTLSQKISEYKNDYGVLCFLYSLLLTKRLDMLKVELEESGESLIDALHGHGSQSLTNLLLSGIATSNVFDGNKDLEGLVLHGTPRQSTIGFLTIMEYLRYCEVGWNLKNPKSPVWVLGSETHLTVFFSKETCLIQENDASRQQAIRTFQQYDPMGCGFLPTGDLEKLMASLDLLTDKEYIEVVKQQLDSENLGIITKVAFLDEFYPKSEQNFIPDKFKVYHYNGLARSNKDNQVQYQEGEAKIIDFTDQPSLEVNSIKNCLQTKWPTIEVNWLHEGKAPSMN